MGKERKKSEERKKEILEVSLEILHEKGHRGLTVRNIAGRIGISEPGVYRHFNNKEEIVIKLAEKVLSENKITAEERDCSSSFGLIRGILLNLFRSLEEVPLATTILFQGDLFSEYPEVEKIFMKHQKKNKKKLKEIVEKGQKEGLISENVDPKTFALILMGSIRVMVLEWRNKDFSYSLINKADQIAEELAKILEN